MDYYHKSIDGLYVRFEISISGRYEKQTRHHPGSTPEVEVVGVEVDCGGNFVELTDEGLAEAFIEAAGGRAAIQEEVLEEAEENRREAEAEYEAEKEAE